MNDHLGSILTTVNAPYSQQLDGPALAACLMNLEVAKQFPGHVSSFLGEVPVALQLAFAAAFGIDTAALRQTASGFAAWSGASVKRGVKASLSDRRAETGATCSQSPAI